MFSNEIHPIIDYSDVALFIVHELKHLSTTCVYTDILDSCLFNLSVGEPMPLLLLLIFFFTFMFFIS